MIHVEGRPKRQGKESELVGRFLASYLSLYSSEDAVTVLVEPKLGFAEPDIVIVQWDPVVSASWPRMRASLTTTDIKLLSFVSSAGPITLSEIRAFFPRMRKSDLLRLEQAEVLYISHDYCIPAETHRAFAARAIIAIEAKRALSTRAIEQAFRNTLFASRSYVVTATASPSLDTLERAADLGLGVYSCPERASLATLVPPRATPLPYSFQAWYINELAWRAIRSRAYVH